VLSPLLYSLFTHDYVAMHAYNSIVKFSDDTTVVGLTTNNDETTYRKEVRHSECGVRKTTSHSTSTKQRRTSGNSRGSTPLSTSKGQQWRRWKV
jgi:hypothetical protein